jgi:hypothetical protein
MIIIFYVIAKPISLALDRVLGQEMTAKYTKQEVRQ